MRKKQLGTGKPSSKDDNLLHGGDGNDRLAAGTGAGNDTLTGGPGADSFAFDVPSAVFRDLGVDSITDFESGIDQIVLYKRVFTSLDSGVFPADRFEQINSTNVLADAGGSNALIVFNQANRGLYYNANGEAAGFGSGGLFAVIGNVSSLSASSIEVKA